MKKAISLVLMLIVALNLFVVGCKKAEEKAPAEAPKVEAPAAPSSDATSQAPAAPEPPASEATKK